MDKLQNGSAGYGSLVNLVKMQTVYMISHHEGIGTPESPVRVVRTFFTHEGQFIFRDDPIK